MAQLKLMNPICLGLEGNQQTYREEHFFYLSTNQQTNKQTKQTHSDCNLGT